MALRKVTNVYVHVLVKDAGKDKNNRLKLILIPQCVEEIEREKSLFSHIFTSYFSIYFPEKLFSFGTNVYLHIHIVHRKEIVAISPALGTLQRYATSYSI